MARHLLPGKPSRGQLPRPRRKQLLPRLSRLPRRHWHRTRLAGAGNSTSRPNPVPPPDPQRVQRATWKKAAQGAAVLAIAASAGAPHVYRAAVAAGQTPSPATATELAYQAGRTLSGVAARTVVTTGVMIPLQQSYAGLALRAYDKDTYDYLSTATAELVDAFVSTLVHNDAALAYLYTYLFERNRVRADIVQQRVYYMQQFRAGMLLLQRARVAYERNGYLIEPVLTFLRNLLERKREAEQRMDEVVREIESETAVFMGELEKLNSLIKRLAAPRQAAPAASGLPAPNPLGLPTPHYDALAMDGLPATFTNSSYTAAGINLSQLDDQASEEAEPPAAATGAFFEASVEALRVTQRLLTSALKITGLYLGETVQETIDIVSTVADAAVQGARTAAGQPLKAYNFIQADDTGAGRAMSVDAARALFFTLAGALLVAASGGTVALAAAGGSIATAGLSGLWDAMDTANYRKDL